MASKRKQEEKHLTLLREMVAKEHNKTCFDCHQRGPTYVNMTVGSFVCTSCSGILRGLNPPNRVKSISMASYTPQEIEYLQNHGNEICRTVWLGLYDAKSQAGPESREENKVRDFMIQKYEKKRWYVEPSQAAAVAKAKADTADKSDKGSVHSNASSGTPEPKPLRTLVGDSTVPHLVVGRTTSSGSRCIMQNTPPATPPNSNASKQSAVDLLGDLGGDPFAAAPAPGDGVPLVAAVQAQAQAQGGFADFSQAFGNQATNQPTQQTPAAFQPFGTMPASTAENDFGAFTSASATTTSVNQTTSKLQNLNLGGTTTASAAATAGGDRYAALSELLTLESSVIDWSGGGLSSSSSVDWSGGSKISGLPGVSSGGCIDWGGVGVKPTSAGGSGSSMFGSTSMPNMAAATSMGGASVGNPGVMGGAISTQAAMPAGFPVAGATAFSSAAVPVSNPFMGTANQTTAVSNPFLGTPVSTSTAMPQSNGMMGQFAAQPATSVSYGASMQPQTTAAYSRALQNQMATRQMNGGVVAGYGQMHHGQFATTGQGEFAAHGQAQFPAPGQAHYPTQGQAQFTTPGQGQFNMQGQGQYPQQGAVGMPSANQMPGYGMQQQPQSLSFGGAGMTAMAGMQFQKMGQPQQPQPSSGQIGIQAGFGVPPQGPQATFSASWGTPTQQQPAMTSNPFMASGFGTQAQLPPKTGSSNPFL